MVFSDSSAFNFLKQVIRARTLKESQPCRLGALPPTTTLEEGTDFCPEGRCVKEKKKGGGEKVTNYSTSFLCQFFHGDNWQPVFLKWNGREEAGKEPTLGIPSPHSHSRNKLLNSLGLRSLPCSTGGSTVMGSYWQPEPGRLLATVTAPLLQKPFLEAWHDLLLQGPNLQHYSMTDFSAFHLESLTDWSIMLSFLIYHFSCLRCVKGYKENYKNIKFLKFQERKPHGTKRFSVSYLWPRKEKFHCYSIGLVAKCR